MILIESDITGEDTGGSGRLGPEIILLLTIIIKCLRSTAMYATFGFLAHNVPVVLLLFCLFLVSAICFSLVHKPWAWRIRLTGEQWVLVLVHTFLTITSTWSWLHAIKNLGPIRTMLATDYIDVGLVAVVDGIVKKKKEKQGSSRQLRGFILVFVALVALYFSSTRIPADARLLNQQSAQVPDTAIEGEVPQPVVNESSGTSAAGVGYVLLYILASVLRRRFAKRLQPAFRNSKKLTTMSIIASLIFLFPTALYQFYVSISASNISYAAFFFGVPLVAVLLLVMDYYVEFLARSKLSSSVLTKSSVIVQFVFALLLEAIWPIVAGLDFATIVAFFFILIGHHLLFASLRGRRASRDDEPLLPIGSTTQAGRTFTPYSSGLTQTLALILKSILSAPDSRKIFLFLCINFSFMFVELLYGFWTNSLGLISDAFHMLFDCTALAIGLWAAVISKWEPNSVFTYGYGRVEVLSGFTNAIFLCFIALSIFIKAIQRMISPPEIKTDRLLLVSVLGLFINLIGVVAFHDFPLAEIFCGKKQKSDEEHHHHHHHGEDGHKHKHKHHEHEHGHGHAHGGHACDHDHKSENLYGIFIHILADTLGSVAVIISSTLILLYDWRIADPIVSLIQSILVFMSTIPLLKGSVTILLQRTPPALEHKLHSALNKLRTIPGVIGFAEPHFWPNTQQHIVGSIHIYASEQANTQKVIAQVQKLFKRKGVHQITVQLNK